MKITLRKANAIQQSIQDLIRGIQVETNISINEFENVNTKLDEATAKLSASLVAIGDLYEALFSIRLLVGKANSEEIDGLITRAAHLEKLIQLNSQLSNLAPRTNIDVLNGTLDKIRASNSEASSVYGSRYNQVNTTVLTGEDIAKVKAAVAKFKKEKQKLQDKVLELNIRTEIELPENVVTILTDADLL